MSQIYRYTTLTFLMASLFVSPVMAANIQHEATIYDASEEAALTYPEGVACSKSFFVVADTGNSQIVRYSLGDQGVEQEAVFPLDKASPIVAQIASDGSMYILDGKSRTIMTMSAEGKVTGKIEPKGVPGSEKMIPRSFKLDKDGNIYILDIFSERVLILDSEENYLRHLPFPEEFGFFSDLAVGPGGSVYLLDSVAGAIYAAPSSAELFTLFSSGLEEYANFPIGLALDSKGVLYLSDQYGSGLILVGADGSFTGRKINKGWKDGQLHYPAQVCINDQGLLFVADRNNHRVQIFNILEE